MADQIPTSGTVIDIKLGWQTTIRRPLKGDIDSSIVKWFSLWSTRLSRNYKIAEKYTYIGCKPSLTQHKASKQNESLLSSALTANRSRTQGRPGPRRFRALIVTSKYVNGVILLIKYASRDRRSIVRRSSLAGLVSPSFLVSIQRISYDSMYPFGFSGGFQLICTDLP